MQRLPQTNIMGQVFDTLRQHAIAVHHGEDSQVAATRLFTAPKAISTGDNSVCCNALIVSEGLHTWCDQCGEYALIVEDRPLIF